MSKRKRDSNRQAAADRFRSLLHRNDGAPARKWNQPEQSQPRPRLPGTGKSSRSARRRRKLERSRVAPDSRPVTAANPDKTAQDAEALKEKNDDDH